MAPLTRSRAAFLYSVPPIAFPSFPSLAPEIRLRIFKYVDVATHHYDVQVELSGITKPVDVSPQLINVRAMTPVPIILHINQESRKEGLRKYVACFLQSDRSRRIYVNFDTDCLFIRYSLDDFPSMEARSRLWTLAGCFPSSNERHYATPMPQKQIPCPNEDGIYRYEDPEWEPMKVNPAVFPPYEYLPLLNKRLKVQEYVYRVGLKFKNRKSVTSPKLFHELLIQSIENPTYDCYQGGFGRTQEAEPAVIDYLNQSHQSSVTKKGASSVFVGYVMGWLEEEVCRWDTAWRELSSMPKLRGGVEIRSRL